MARALKVCSTSGCPELTSSGRCPACTRKAEQQRGSPASRGYGYRWRTAIRPQYLRDHPICVLCGAVASVPDHWPVDRRTLVADGCPDPDAEHRMRALCKACHDVHTAQEQAGGWHART
jgi:5-methylcytosine-specific restriction protein A